MIGVCQVIKTYQGTFSSCSVRNFEAANDKHGWQARGPVWLRGYSRVCGSRGPCPSKAESCNDVNLLFTFQI